MLPASGRSDWIPPTIEELGKFGDRRNVHHTANPQIRKTGNVPSVPGFPLFRLRGVFDYPFLRPPLSPGQRFWGETAGGKVEHC